MIKYIDVSGKTEDEAIQLALSKLSMDRDDVSVEILERAKSGFLGIGGTPATVRVSYDDGMPEPKEEKKTEEKPPVKKPVTYQPEILQKKEVRAKEKPERKEKEPREKESREERRSVKPAELGEECRDEKSEQIRTFLQGLMEHLDSNAVARVYLSEEGHYKVILEGEHLGQLIGRRGETLDAIQQLTSYAVNRGADRRVRIHVDAENYRAKREQTLEALARKVAGKVVRLRRNVTLEPMNAYERHVIHSALQEYPGVSTASIGTEPNRRVVVHYERPQRSNYQKK